MIIWLTCIMHVPIILYATLEEPVLANVYFWMPWTIYGFMFEENTDILILRTHSFSFLIFAPPFEMVQVKELNAVSSQIHRTRHLELNFFFISFHGIVHGNQNAKCTWHVLEWSSIIKTCIWNNMATSMMASQSYLQQTWGNTQECWSFKIKGWSFGPTQATH